MKVGDFVVERLHAWGVRRIYGYPGDGINGVIGALQRAGNIEFIQVRHEEMAAFMAVAHAKFTGELGVCLSTGGPGATHLITGLYDGKLDHAPVLAICGQAEATVRGASYQQELNLDRMFADVAGFVQEASSPAQVRHLLDRCVRVAKGIQRAVRHHPAKGHSGRGLRGAGGCARVHAIGRRLLQAKDRSRGCRPDEGGGNPECRQKSSHAGRRRRPRDGPTADRDGHASRSRRGEGAARKGRAAGRPALRHRRDRPARYRAKLGTHARLRHASDGRDRLSLVRIPAQGRRRPRRSDRHRSLDAFAALPGRRQPARRRGRNAESAAASHPAQGRSGMVEDDRGQHGRLVEEAGRPREGGRQSRQSAARRLGNVALAAGERHRHQRQRILRQLVCPRLPGAAGPIVRRSRAAWRRWVRPSPTPSAPSSLIRTGR